MNQSTFNQISPHVYWLSPDATTDRPVLGAVAGTERTLIVDAGNSPAHARLLLQHLADVEIPPPAFLALTHWHWDHVFGAATIELPTFAHAETARIVAAMTRLDWSDEALDRRVKQGVEIAFCRDMIKAELPDRSNLVLRAPDIAFTHQVEIYLGAARCQIVHVGGDHAADSSVVYVPGDKVMFLGDCLSPDLYSGEPSYSAGNVLRLVDQLLRFDVDFYLAGHSPEPLSRDEIVEYAHLLQTVAGLVEQRGDDRAAVLAALQERLAVPLTEEHLETVDEFLAGIRKSTAERASSGADHLEDVANATEMP